jgi:hypothetical protein
MSWRRMPLAVFSECIELNCRTPGLLQPDFLELVKACQNER